MFQHSKPGLLSSRLGVGRWLRWLAGLCLIAAPLARAELQFDVFIGYDGVVREASWTPFVCELRNDGLPISGFIEISPGGAGKGQSYRVPIELPNGTTKRLTIPVFTAGPYATAWNIRLANAKGKTIVEKPGERARRHLGWEIPLMGSLSRTAAGAPSIRPILRDDPAAQPAVAKIQPAIFPENPLVLEGLNAIYLSSDVIAGLREGQVNALLAWMNAGGHLIVAVEQVSDVTASPWLRSVLPFEPRDMKVISAHTDFQAWLRSPLDYADALVALPQLDYGGRRGPDPRVNASAEAPFASLPDDMQFELADMQIVTGSPRGGRKVVSCGNLPVIVTADRGRGRLTALLFSPEREPFKSWKNLSSFWARLLEVPGLLYTSTDFYRGMSQSPDGIFGAMIDSRQVHKLPLGWLLILLVVYLVVIGPFDQWWLKRIGKPMLTWITFPIYMLLFSGLIYLLGYKLRAGESEFNELHLVDVLRNGEKAELRGRSYVSIYSPTNAKFPLTGKTRFGTLRGEFLGYGTEVSDRGVVDQVGDSFKTEVFVPVWSSQLFLSDWWQSAGLPFEVTTSPTIDGWNVVVKNRTANAVKASHLVMENQIYALGEIGKEQTATFALHNDGGVALNDFVQRSGGNNFTRVAQRRQNVIGTTKSGRITDLPNAVVAASFLSRLRPDQSFNMFILPPGLELGRYAERGGALFLAWSPETRPGEPMHQFKPKRASTGTLWRMPITVAATK